MNVNFEFAALLPLPYSRVKSVPNSKQTFIWSPSIRSYIILALDPTRSLFWSRLKSRQKESEVWMLPSIVGQDRGKGKATKVKLRISVDLIRM